MQFLALIRQKFLGDLDVEALWDKLRAQQYDLISAASILILGAAAAWICHWACGLFIRRLQSRWKDDTFPERLRHALQKPISFLVLLYFGVWAFDQIKAMPSTLWTRMHSDIYPIANGVLILILGFRLVDVLAQLMQRKWAPDAQPLDERWADILSYVGKGLVLAVGALTILQQMGINILPLLTGAGFFGAAVALASQNTIANAIGSLEIRLDRLFREGDRIAFADYDGFVARMGLRSIHLRALSGEIITLPNKDLVDKQIRNMTRGNISFSNLTVGIGYEHSRPEVEKAIGILKSTISAHPRVKECSVIFKKLGANALELEANFWANYNSGGEHGTLMTELHLALKENLDAADIEIAYPTTTVHLRQPTTSSPAQPRV